ncbi:GroES-like protein [Dendrothele bispora CBS 962.96]|uniref:GroES-like protein n=1 Tax=Dendrothele bispora (strain CBS 962.96) TaxID=1314807 RepID=A0A4S8M4R8_DENBC|nr:GroES-like protein [Dendrothele bispora CBS 962.96]
MTSKTFTAVPSTQTAALYRPGDINLNIIHDYPVPKPGKGEVLLKVLAAGVCHSDTTLLSGALLDTRTYVLGHEIAGEVVEYGEGVNRDHIRMKQLYIILAADHKDHGMNGSAAFLNSIGIGMDGGFAEYLKVRTDNLVPAPSGMLPEVAAIAADAGITAFDAVHNKAGAMAQSPYSVGGLGHLAVQYAKHFGATVYACDYKPEARQLALELGAIEAFSLIELTNKIKEGFTVNTTIDFLANGQSFQMALDLLKGNGVEFPSKATAVLVGVTLENLTLNSIEVLTSGINLISTTYGSRKDAESALDLFAKGIVRPIVSTESLHNVNDVIDELRASKVRGRKVVIPSRKH